MQTRRVNLSVQLVLGATVGRSSHGLAAIITIQDQYRYKTLDIRPATDLRPILKHCSHDISQPPNHIRALFKSCLCMAISFTPFTRW